jgi:hypothetical protein
MGFIQEDYQNQYAFSFESKTLGRLRIWAIMSHAATKALSHHFQRRDESPRDFMLFLLSITAAQENPENPRHREEFLTLDRLSALSDEEVDAITSNFLKHHTYLFQGHKVTRNDKESDLEFLRRVVEGYRKTQNQATIARIDQMTAGLSKALMPDLSAITRLNTSIGSSLEALRNSQSSLVLLPPSNSQHKTNDLLNEVINIVSRQNEASERTVLAIGQLAQLGESWQESALESSTAAARQVRLTNILAVIMTILTILAVVLTYLSYKAAILPR